MRTPLFTLFALFASLFCSLYLSPGLVCAADRAITVASASSLGNALKEVAVRFESVSGVAVRLSFASTGVLAAQVEQGAPFDIFIAADKSYAYRLEQDGGLVSGSVKKIAEGRLVIVVNKASGIKIKGIKELGAIDARMAIGNPAHVPYGAAAVEALKNAGVWQGVGARFVYGENVRQALQFVQSGNAAVGIVAESVAGVKGVYTVDVPRNLYPPIELAAGIVAGTRHRLEAGAFMLYLASPEVRNIFHRYGLTATGLTR